MGFEFWVFEFYFTYRRIGDLELVYSTYKQARLGQQIGSG